MSGEQGPGGKHRAPGSLHATQGLAPRTPQQAEQHTGDQQSQEDDTGDACLGVGAGGKGRAELDSAYAGQYEARCWRTARDGGEPSGHAVVLHSSVRGSWFVVPVPGRQGRHAARGLLR